MIFTSFNEFEKMAKFVNFYEFLNGRPRIVDLWLPLRLVHGTRTKPNFGVNGRIENVFRTTEH